MSKEHSINLDIVRIIGAAMVLAVHVGNYSKNFTYSAGFAGVWLFFILSAYLNGFSQEKSASIRSYYYKRLLAIIPTYYFALFFLYLKEFVLYSRYMSLMNVLKGPCGIKYLRYFFFVHMITPSDNYELWNNRSALWTMSLFFVFYAFAPFLYKVINSFIKALIATIIILILTPYWNAVLYSILNSRYSADAQIEMFCQLNPISQFYCFMLGITLFHAINEGKEVVVFFIGIITMIITNFEYIKFELLFTVLIGIAAKCDEIRLPKTIKRYIPFAAKGTLTLYLIHPIILQVTNKVLSNFEVISTELYTFLLFFIAIIGSYFVYANVIIKFEQYFRTVLSRNISVKE